MKRSKIPITEEIREYVNYIINKTQLSTDEKYEAREIMRYALQDMEEVIAPRVGYSIGTLNDERYSSKDNKKEKKRK